MARLHDGAPRSSRLNPEIEMLRLIAIMILLAATAWTSTAKAETTLCTEITSLPANITTQGVYCLKHDLTTAMSSGTAITIASNNVTIDCNDWKIGGLAAGAGTGTVGIGGTDRVNITIRHCGVRGFLVGIYLDGTSGGGHLIEDNRLDLNTGFGLYAIGDNLVVRRNRVLQTGGKPAASGSSAVYLSGNGVVVDNFINGDTPTGVSGNANAFGLNLGVGPFQVDHNFVGGLVPLGTGVARGIWGDIYPGSYRNNMVVNSSAVAGTGIDGVASGASACSDNTVHNFATGVTNCTDAGGNVSN